MQGQTNPTAAASATPTSSELRVRPGDDGVTVAVGPQRAGWRYLSFATRGLGKDERMPFRLEASESVIVVVSGGGVTVEVNGRQPVELAGRRSVFDGLPWAVYLPAGSRGRIVGRPIRGDGRTLIAAAVAPITRDGGSTREPVSITPDDVTVEIVGAGTATRQLNRIVGPDFPAERLQVMETLTPGGNWSSWPPHKHDTDALPDEARLEELSYFQFRRPEAWAIQRLYRADRSRDLMYEVRHGDVVLIPDGYHPFSAGHGDDAYHLSVLAGDQRALAASDEPDFARDRAAWTRMTPDERVPIVRGAHVASRPSVVPVATPAESDAVEAPAAVPSSPPAEPSPGVGDAPAVTPTDEVPAEVRP
jgi:5-deoxy-glucuronate isomerase